MSFGQFDAGTDKTQFSAISFLIEQAMLKMQTVTLVKVIAVHSNGVGITGTVDVQPMVNQMQAGPNGTQTAIAHGTIYGVPFFRLQGGVSAFICDPVAGDIGLCGFAARDISSVKSTRAVANPGSQRTYDWADGLYVGGFINGVPTQYIQALAAAGGWKIVTPGDITLDAPLTEVTGDLLVDGDTTLTGDTTVDGATTLVGPTTAAAITSSGVITAAGFSGPGGTSPAGPPGPPGPTGPIGPAFLSVSDGTTTTPNITEIIFNGATVTISGSTATVTGSGGGSITDITGSSFITITNGTGPTVGVDLSSSFQAAYAATAALAVTAEATAATALQPKTGLAGSYTSTNLTIDSNGQITAVSNGSGGGGGFPSTLPDLVCWFAFDNINSAAGKIQTGLFDRTPWRTGAAATLIGSTTAIAPAQLNGLNTVLWANGNAFPLSPSFSMAGGGTYFIVINGSTASGNQAIIGGSVNALSLYFAVGSSPHLQLVQGSTALLTACTTAWTPGTWFQGNVTYDSATGNFAYRQARTAANSGTTTAFAVTASSYFGSDGGMSTLNAATVAEFIAYNRVLSPTEIANVEAYLLAKWGV